MAEGELEALKAVIPPLLQALEGLGFISRHLNPPDLARVLEAAGESDAALKAAMTRLDDWPQALAPLRGPIGEAGAAALAGFEALRTAEDARDLFRALEALYPLAAGLAPVSRYFLPPAARPDADLLAKLAQAPARDDVGVFHVSNEPGSRGG